MNDQGIMNDQNQNQTPNADDEQPVFTKSEMNAIVQQRLQQDRARRGNPPPASAPSPGSAGADARFDKLEGMFGILLEKLSGQGTPTPEPTPAPAQRPPAAAPSAPQSTPLPTKAGLVNLFAMTPDQFLQLRQSGELRGTWERTLAAAESQNGAPRRPTMPWQVDPNGIKHPTRGR